MPASHLHRCLPAGRTSLCSGGLKREDGLGSPPALTKRLLSSPILRDEVPLCFGLWGSPGCLLPVHVHPPPCLTAQGSSSICYINHTHRLPTIFSLFPLCHEISHLETEGRSRSFSHCHCLQAILLCHLLVSVSFLVTQFTPLELRTLSHTHLHHLTSELLLTPLSPPG